LRSSADTQPLEVSLVHDVKACRSCTWFWSSAPPYGPYPGFIWDTQFPAAAIEKGAQSATTAAAAPWLKATLNGAHYPDPGIMHGCRKAPIMTIGINPNLTAWFPYTSGARHVYPAFADESQYAYYYRHFTLYQEGIALDFVRQHIAAEERLVAEEDGWVIGATRGSSHNFMLLTVHYRGRTTPTVHEIAWTPEKRWVVVQDNGRDSDETTWFKKGALLAGRFDAPSAASIELFREPAGYYQRMVEVLRRLEQKAGLAHAKLSVGEDVAQHDLVSCASPGWQEKFDMPLDRIASECVSERGWLVSQLIQSRPAVVILVGESALAMFRQVFGASMELPNTHGDVHRLLQETATRPRYLTIDEAGVKFRARILVPPHFSYPANYLPQARLSVDAWAGFKRDFSADAAILENDERVMPPASGMVAVELDGGKEAVRPRLSVSGSRVLESYVVDSYELLAAALADELKSGGLAFDAKSGHLVRGDGPCCFCVNDRWKFPEGCAYGKADEKPLPARQAEAAVSAILARAREAQAAGATHAAASLVRKPAQRSHS
jgi:hypothetical protein